MGRALHLAVLLVVIQAIAAVQASERAEIVFKPCKSTVGIPKCKVKSVLVNGCQKEMTHDMNHIPNSGRSGSNWRKGLRISTCNVNQKTKLNFTITIDSGFSADRLSSQFSLVAPRLDCSPEGAATHCLFRQYVRNGCKGTNCPLNPSLHPAGGRPVNGQEVTDSLKINPDSDIAKGQKYTTQWKLWNKSNEKENCCFMFKLWYF